jgi:hypothetical protein
MKGWKGDDAGEGESSAAVASARVVERRSDVGRPRHGRLDSGACEEEEAEFV